MEIHFVHHPVMLWHPAMLTAVIVPGLIAWMVGRSVTRLAQKVRTTWLRILSQLVPVAVTAAFVVVLTFVLFDLVWRHIEGPNALVEFGYFNRFALLVPVAVLLISLRQGNKTKKHGGAELEPRAV